MNKSSATGTSHILPFGELSPAQFERLCLWLVEHEGYEHAEHLGEAGSEQGRDVTAYRNEQLWYFQCKRYQTISAPTLIAEVEKYNEHIAAGTIAKPHGIVFVTNAVLSAKARKSVQTFCQTHSYECEFWARTELDLKVKKHGRIVKEFFNLTLPPAPPEQRISIARLPQLLTRDLFGRDKELQLLEDAWANPHPDRAKINVVTFVAWGGVGKTALVNHWVRRLGARNYDGAARVYAWSFYSQGTSDDRAATAEYFINDALRWFGDPDPTAGSPWDKGERLAQLIRAQRTLLVLDGLEPLQQPPNNLGLVEGRLKEQSMQALLRELAAGQPGLCVISTREAVTELEDYESAALRCDLDQLTPEAGAQLLGKLGVTGEDDELKQAAEEFGGHSLALTLLGGYLHEVFNGDVRRRHEIEALSADAQHGGHARRVMASYERWLGDGPELAVLRLLGLFDRPADAGSVAALRAAPAIPGLTDALQNLSETKWQQTLAKLRRIKLLAERPAQASREEELDAHPLVREHFRTQLKAEQPDAWRAGNLYLYEHLIHAAKEFPDTIEEAGGLYTAVVHGCEAGKYQEVIEQVYWQRILRGDETFSKKKLGAFSADLAALSSFFDSLWSQPIAELGSKWKPFVLAEVGFDLRALGRMAEATQPMEAGFEANLAQEDWKNAAMAAANLSELYFFRGNLTRALRYAEQGVELADRSRDAFQPIFSRAVLADALHQMARFSEAQAIFRDAEQLQKVKQPELPYLYSAQGFRYYDFLLTQKKYQEVQNRIEAVPKEVQNLLGAALAYLSLGQVHLLKRRDEGNADFTQSFIYLTQAVGGLRQAGRLDFLPRGLLARAELRRVRADYPHARMDLDEAQRLAERSQMGLYLADCHLERARLCLATGEREVARAHWAEAKAMIEQMGYHRRDGEVAELARELEKTA